MAAKKPNKQAGVEPSVRTFTTWTPALIRSAEMQADMGNLRQAASLCDWLLGDDRVPGTLGNRVQTLLGLEPTFEASGDKRRSNRVVRALEVSEDWWAAYPEQELAQLHTWALLLGVAPARHGWETFEDHGGRILPLPLFWHPQHLRQDQQTREWKIRVASSGTDVGTEETLVPGDSTWILHTPYGRNRPWSMGLWRGLARFVLLKYYAIQDWARHSEKGSLLVATMKSSETSEASTREQRRDLANDIYARGQEAVVVLPDDFDLKLLEATANTKQIYEAQIRMADEAIAVAVRGGNLTTVAGQDGGSRAATEAQAKGGDNVKLKFDAQSLTTTIHDQSLVWWAEFNFGDSKLAPWPVYPVEEEEDLKQKVESEEKAFTVVKQAEDLGFAVDRKAFLEEHKITWAKPGEKPPAPVPPTPPAAPAPGTAAPVPPPSNEGEKQEPAVKVDPKAIAAALEPAVIEAIAANLQKPKDGVDGENGRDGEPGQNGADGRDGENGRDGRDGADAALPPQVALVARLASGFLAAKASGFLNGQLYADKLVDEVTADGIEALEPTLEAILEVLDQATDYDDLRERLRKRYETLDPEALTELVTRAMLLANLAGRAAVNEDV